MGGASEVAKKSDELVIAPRHGDYFTELVVHKGADINNGAKAGALIVAERKDEAVIHLDIIGVGTSPYDFLTLNNIQVVAINGSAGAHGTTANGLLKFFNRRAELYWRMREALDPGSGRALAIAPDPLLLAELAAPRWWLGKSGIQIESKDDIRKRLGRSPDRGDALVNALVSTPKRKMVLGAFSDPRVPRQGYDEQRLKELES